MTNLRQSNKESSRAQRRIRASKKNRKLAEYKALGKLKIQHFHPIRVYTYEMISSGKPIKESSRAQRRIRATEATKISQKSDINNNDQKTAYTQPQKLTKKLTPEQSF